MVYTKKLFIEITTLKKINKDIIYLSLKKNIPESHISIYSAERIELRDI